MTLREIRNENNITILEASKISEVPVRTYIRYEQDEEYGNKVKRNAIKEAIKTKCEITEEKGLLDKDLITKKCAEVFKEYGNKIDFCYLFGSYAKGYSTEKSDVDLCISTKITGLEFMSLGGELQEKLHKNVDLLRLVDINKNPDLLKEIMKDGIKIYG